MMNDQDIRNESDAQSQMFAQLEEFLAMPENHVPLLARLLKERREKMGLTISELSRKAGVSKSLISRLESGRTHRSHEHNIEKIAGALELDAERLKRLMRPPNRQFLNLVQEWQNEIEPETRPEPYYLNKVIMELYMAISEHESPWARRRGSLRLYEIYDRLPNSTEKKFIKQVLMKLIGEEEQSQVKETYERLLKCI